MCVGKLHTYFLYWRTHLYNETTDSYDSLSSANQRIHELRDQIRDLESQIAMQHKMIAEETAMRYKAWKQLADFQKEASNSGYDSADIITGR